MATPISEEELQLKKRARRRLIGAIALVTVVAVFLPMVLDHEPKTVSQDINIQIPAQNAGTFTSKIVPVVPGGGEARPDAVPPTAVAAAPKAAVPAGVDSEAAPPKAVPEEPKARPKVAAKAPPPVDSEAAPPKAAAAEPKAAESKAKPAAEPKPKPKPVAKADKRDGGSFVVQVAALSDGDKARQMREQIATAGVKAYTEVVPTAGGNVTRVRAGPFASRDAAEKARDRLKELGLTGQVVPK
jgi:DedD protein